MEIDYVFVLSFMSSLLDICLLLFTGDAVLTTLLLLAFPLSSLTTTMKSMEVNGVVLPPLTFRTFRSIL